MRLNELGYHGNIGVMEMVKFHEMASDEQKKRMKELLATKEYKAAWQLLKQVTDVALHDTE